MYIADLQESCYGSVSDQIDFFEKSMHHYTKTEITNSKLNALNQLLSDEETKKTETLQDFISLASILLTAIFGLPSIYETLGLLRQYCSFIKKNIPYLSQTNMSIVVWFIILIMICVNYLYQRFKRK